ncbi:MAG: hypothetical protein HQL32_02930 [Planctomycetes bacterium]|nr:hypothetical protein [Planctomycetota bacterium]
MAKRVLSEEEIVKDRLAYLGTLAGGLAHEVRSPLNSIHLNIEMLEKAGCEQENQEGIDKFNKRVGRIKLEVSNLQKTLTEFLQFAKPPGVKRMATDLKDYLHDVVEFIDAELNRENIRVKFNIAEHSYPVLIDRRQMEQVLQNLLFNARDAMSEGVITISTYENNHHVFIELEDEGPGMDEDVKERIFDAFFTTKKKGTGLGLGICRRIVDEHNGGLEVESPLKNGKGCIFRIILPKEKLLSYSPENEDASV